MHFVIWDDKTNSNLSNMISLGVQSHPIQHIHSFTQSLTNL